VAEYYKARLQQLAHCNQALLKIGRTVHGVYEIRDQEFLVKDERL
jgi:hypothetical protein